MRRILLVLVALLSAAVTTADALTLDELQRDIRAIPLVTIMAPATEAADQLKAVQVFVLPSRSAEFEAQLASWREAGINSIILRVFHNSGDRYHYYKASTAKEGVYFKTSRAPVVADALGDVLRAAKEKGFRVYAWMTTRYASYGRPRLPRMAAYSFERKKIVEAKGLDPFAADAREHILGLFSDLAAYPLDGILLQDDLFVKHNEGFTPAAIASYTAATGSAPEPRRMFIVNGDGKISYTDEFWAWRRWKSGRIAELVAELRNGLREKNPAARLIVNLTYEAVSHPKGALAWLAHDIETLKPGTDYFSLMAYHRQIMDELQLDFDGACRYVADMVRKCREIFPDEPQRFLFKLQVKDWTTNEAIDEDEIRALVARAGGIGSLSLAVVPYPPSPSPVLLKELFGGKLNAATPPVVRPY